MSGWLLLAAAAVAAEGRPVPFDRDADWIGGLYQMRTIQVPTGPVALDFDPSAAPDVRVLPPGVPVTVPLTGTAATVYVMTVGSGDLRSTGVAADGELRYADGRVQALKWMVGEQIWPAWAGATGRGAEIVPLGVNVAGDTITASLLTVPTSWTDAALVSLTITARPGTVPMALAGITLSASPAVTPELPVVRTPGRVPLYRPSPAPPNPPIVGPVRVRDAHLVDPSGARLRFWGVNLVGAGNLPQDPEAFAAQLEGLGFNLVRLHHLDQEGVLPNPKRGEPGQPAALPAQLDRLDASFAALARHGIYSVVELMTLRSFRAGEGVPGFEGVPLGNKYANQIWPAWLEAEKAWARAVWGRVNPYTGRRYADDPAVAMVELSNENSLVVGWSSGALERLPKLHRDELDRQWNAWLRARYPNDARLAEAWSGSVHPGLQAGETLSLDSVARWPDARNRADQWPQARAADLVRFYAERERAHQAALARFVRDELGFTAPLICNTSFNVPAADALLADCDVIDVHLYWDPIYESTVFTNLSLVETPIASRVLEELSGCQADKPCVLGELQHSYPNQYAHEAPLVWAALASRQDLDAVTWFAWSHDTPDLVVDGPSGALDLRGRLDTLVQMPVAAALFRSGAVPAAAGRHVRWWTPDGILRDLAEQPGLWLTPQVGREGILRSVVRTAFGAGVSGEPGAEAGAPPVAWGRQGFTIDTPGLAAVVGREGAVGPYGVSLDTFAATWMVDEGSGVRALWIVSHGERDGTVWTAGGPGPAVLGKGGYRVAPVTGTVWLAGRRRPSVTAPDGSRLTVRRAGEGWALQLVEASPGRFEIR